MGLSIEWRLECYVIVAKCKQDSEARIHSSFEGTKMFQCLCENDKFSEWGVSKIDGLSREHSQ